MSHVLASPHWWADPGWLTVIGAIATAIFTGCGLVIAAQVRSDSLRAQGRRNPIVVRGTSKLSTLELEGIRPLRQKIRMDTEHPEYYRVAVFRLVSHSQTEETIVIDGDKTGVLWPRRVQREVISRGYEIPVRGAGLVNVIIRGAWPDDPMHQTGIWFHRLYVVRFRAETTTGHRIRKTLRIPTRPCRDDEFK